MIEVKDLCFAYHKNDYVIDNHCFQIEKGSCVALIGGNGSGKSTLLILLAGLYSPKKGWIKIGQAVSPGQEKKFRQMAALLMQEPDLQILGGTVKEDLLLTLKNLSDPKASKAEKIAERFGLQGKLDSPVQNLSGGEKRKLCLASLLLGKPEIILYDEPFSGLDYPAAKELRAHILRSKKQGLTQLLAVHDLEPIADLVDSGLVLFEGRIAMRGKLEMILDHIEDYSIRPPCFWKVSRQILPWD